MQTISILGAGWLGFPLAMQLKATGYEVHASATREEKLESFTSAGVSAFQILLGTETPISPAFWSDALVMCFPPGKGGDYSSYPQKVNEVLKQLPEKTQRIVLISSTSVYPKRAGNWGEDVPFQAETSEAEYILQAEQLLIGQFPNAVIIRMSGLAGADRNPARFGSSKLPGNEPVNMIHQTDAVGVIISMLHHPETTGIFNACAQEHPLRAAFYEAGAVALHLPKPAVLPSENPLIRTISSEKLRSQTGYVFQLDNPLQFWE